MADTNDITDMDAALTWEILSRLSSAASAPESDGDGAPPPPFFAQREEEGTGVATTAATSSADDAAPPPFLAARPLLCAADDGAGDDDCGAFPALYAREAIADDFRRVLRLHRHGDPDGGRVSPSEMAAWLGMEEGDADAVGRWLCDEDGPSLTGGGAEDDGGGRVCRVRRPGRRRHDYALAEGLRDGTRDRIGRSAWTEGDDCVPSLEALATQMKHGGASPTSSPATMTNQQLAREMELTCEDVAWLKEGIDSDALLASKMEKSRTQALEKQVLGSLSGVTVPTSVSEESIKKGKWPIIGYSVPHLLAFFLHRK